MAQTRIPGSGLSANLTLGNVTVDGIAYFSSSILPTSNNTVNIGSATQRFGTVYLSANTIDIGGATISTSGTGDIQFGTTAGTVEFNSNTVNFLSNVATEGPQGAVGYTGSAGTNGTIGVDGYTGGQGAQGSPGYTGSRGTDGVIGVDGYTGSRGDIGYTGSQIGTDFNTSIDGVGNYAVTSTLANAAVFGSNVVVYGMYVTNIDTTASGNAAVTASLRQANGTTVVLANQIPVPYRGAVELFKQPKYFATGDAIQLQGFNNGAGANSFFHTSLTFQTVTDNSYQYAATNIAAAATATNVYVSTGAASVLQSVMLTNSANLGNIAVTATIVNSSNAVQGYLSSELLIPVNSTIELCEQPRRMASGDALQVTASGANTVTVTVAARRI